LWESQKEREHWEDPDVGEWTILGVMLREIGWDGGDWIDMAQDRDQWRACEHGIEPSGSIKCWKVLEWLHNWRLFKMGSNK
jgi:hypothetical protein